MRHNCFIKYSTIGMCVAGLGFFAGCDRLPYGLEHRKINETAWLGSEALAWKNRGAKDEELTSMQFTNNSGMSLSRYQTNIVVNGASYETILKLDEDCFMGRGSLVAARDGTVIWVGNEGKCEITHHAKR